MSIIRSARVYSCFYLRVTATRCIASELPVLPPAIVFFDVYDTKLVVLDLIDKARDKVEVNDILPLAYPSLPSRA